MLTGGRALIDAATGPRNYESYSCQVDLYRRRLIIFIELAACKTLVSKRTARTTRAAIETPPEQYRHMRDGTASARGPDRGRSRIICAPRPPPARSPNYHKASQAKNKPKGSPFCAQQPAHQKII